VFKRGEVYENPVTGERAVVLLGTEETKGERLVIDLCLRRPGSVCPRHLHPSIRERITVLSGRICFFINDKSFIANLGETIDIPPGTVHDWWNAGIYEARVTLDIQPAARFEEFLRNALGLAQDGRTNSKGTPTFLQQVLLAREFADVIQFTKPSPTVQRIIFTAFAPLARLLGYSGTYPQYVARPPAGLYQLERSPNSNQA
jgi:quercetin dioxygenase-like cupin family protein